MAEMKRLTRDLGHLEPTCPKPKLCRVHGVDNPGLLRRGPRGMAESPGQVQRGPVDGSRPAPEGWLRGGWAGPCQSPRPDPGLFVSMNRCGVGRTSGQHARHIWAQALEMGPSGGLPTVMRTCPLRRPTSGGAVQRGPVRPGIGGRFCALVDKLPEPVGSHGQRGAHAGCLATDFHSRVASGTEPAWRASFSAPAWPTRDSK